MNTNTTGSEWQVIDQMVTALILPDATMVSLLPDYDNPGLCRFWPYQVPQGTIYPAGTFVFLGLEHDALSEGAYRQMSTAHVAFNIWGEGYDINAIAAAQQRMDTLLHQHSGQYDAGRVLAVVRTGTWGPPVSSANGKVYIRAGGQYRIQIGS